MKAAVIVFPGSNCDRDVAVALQQSTGQAPTMIWHKDGSLPKVDLVVLPGGFSYGDYLRSGAMAARSPVMRDVVQKAGLGVPVLGICNGFQVLTECGLLPGALLRNACLRYVCRDVILRVETSQSLFTNRYQQGQTITIPIAHGEGNYFAGDDLLDELEEGGQVAFRYSDAEGALVEDANPNGSRRNIAGIFNKAKTILGMMPHPERLADPLLGGNDGRLMFDGLVEALS